MAGIRKKATITWKGEHRGLYPGYPDPETSKLILTEAIIDAATLQQLPEITKAVHYPCPVRNQWFYRAAQGCNLRVKGSKRGDPVF
jgi:hypothetical protein